MKKLIALLLFLPILAFGQVTESNGVCSDLKQDGSTIQWGGCITIPATVPDPVPPPVAGFTSINCFGDSWTDNVRYTSWCNVLASNTGIALDNKAVDGATTGEIDQQVSTEISQGVDSTGVYFWWALPNDLWVLQQNPNLVPQVIQQIEDNATASFSALQSVGITNLVILATPDFAYIPMLSGPGGPELGVMVDTAIRNAAANVGWSDKVYETNPFFQTLGSSAWLSDGRHFNQATHSALASQVESDLF